MTAAAFSTPARRSSPGDFLRVLDVLLPGGGNLMVQVESYFDETWRDGKPMFCVAGYILVKEQAETFTRALSDILDHWKLPFFRMGDCAHGNPPFDLLSDAQRVEVEKQLIEIIKRHTKRGFAFSLDLPAFDDEVPLDDPRFRQAIGSAYSLSVRFVLGFLEDWLRQNPWATEMSYFFEAGHAKQGHADMLMKFLFSRQKLEDRLRYGGHAFIPKDKPSPVQAADLLAWQWRTDRERHTEGKPRRKDCTSLLEHPHTAMHLDAELMREFVSALRTGERERLMTLAKDRQIVRSVGGPREEP